MNKREMRVVYVAALVLAAHAGCSYIAPRNRAAGPSVHADGIKFQYYAPAAVRVQLAGNWPGNNWARGDGSAGEADIGLMTAGKDGMWEIVVALDTGRYTYLFWVDETTWHLDPANPEEVAGGPVGVASQLLVFKRGGKREIR
jgi:hypothetical protein